MQNNQKFAKNLNKFEFFKANEKIFLRQHFFNELFGFYLHYFSFYYLEHHFGPNSLTDLFTIKNMQLHVNFFVWKDFSCHIAKTSEKII